MVSGCPGQWRLPRARRLRLSDYRVGFGRPRRSGRKLALPPQSPGPAPRPGGPTDCQCGRPPGGRARPARSESAWQRRSRRRSEPAQSNSEPESESPTVAARAGPVARARHCAGCGRINLASPVLEGGPAAAALPGAPGSGLRTHCSSVRDRDPRRRGPA
jgi:hypothetical protein